MKIELSFYTTYDLIDRLDGFDGFVVKKFGAGHKLYKFDSESEFFKKLLKTTKNIRGIVFSTDLKFSKEELNDVKFYSIRGMKFIKESKGDFSKNIDYEDRIDLTTTSDNYKIRLLKKIYLNKINLKPNYICGVGDGNIERRGDYITTSFVKDLIKKERFSGIDFLPLYRSDNTIHDNFFQLYSDQVMPVAIIDNITSKIGREEVTSYLLNLHCFIYDYADIDFDYDFIRSAEPIFAAETPALIISNKVYKFINKVNIKGIKFEPVLDSNSQLYKDYLERWGKVFEKLAIRDDNKIMGWN